MLNTQSPIPLYRQLADLLTGQIRSGQYLPGDMIPSETGMAKEYGIGRPTVRQAMDVLVRKGLVERKRGSGTFVCQEKETVDLFSLAGTSQAFLTRGIDIQVKTLAGIRLESTVQDPANPFKKTSAFFLSRLTIAEDQPVLIEDIWLHAGLFTGLDEVDLENRSLAQVVSEKYYLDPTAARQTFKVSNLSENRAGLLQLDPDDPVLAVERWLDFSDIKNAVFSRLYCRTDRFGFSQIINAGGEPSLRHNPAPL